MSGRCACAEATCQCVIIDSDTIAFGGAGAAASPYQAEIIPDGVAPLLVSVDAGNRISLGSDGLLDLDGPWTLHSTAAPVGNVGPGVDTLANVNVPASTLAGTGDRLRFRAMLTLDAAAENNGFTFSYGGTPFVSFPAAAPVDATIIVEGEIIRTAAATQAAITERSGTGPAIVVARTDMAEDNTVANAFLITGQSGGAGETNAVVLESLTIDVLPL